MHFTYKIYNYQTIEKDINNMYYNMFDQHLPHNSIQFIPLQDNQFSKFLKLTNVCNHSVMSNTAPNDLYSLKYLHWLALVIIT